MSNCPCHFLKRPILPIRRFWFEVKSPNFIFPPKIETEKAATNKDERSGLWSLHNGLLPLIITIFVCPCKSFFSGRPFRPRDLCGCDIVINKSVIFVLNKNFFGNLSSRENFSERFLSTYFVLLFLSGGKCSVFLSYLLSLVLLDLTTFVTACVTKVALCQTGAAFSRNLDDAQCYLPSKIFSFETSLATANICHEKSSKLNIIL